MSTARVKKSHDTFDRRQIAQLERRLVAWYQTAAHDLPWRRTRDPYAIWISEVMLQQTQVVTVIDYYHRFLARFPDPASLATAPEDDVLRLWEGLGYYRRARQLHAAAREIVSRHQGRLPSEAETLRQLPGIGRYTAGAVLSIAFDRREPILEANTIRLVSRLIGYRGDVKSSEGQAILWEAAESWLPHSDVGRFNQALMELGALVCTPKSPKCNECPLSKLCVAYREGAQDEIPSPAKPPRIELVREVALVIRHRERILVNRCEAGKRWAGLWDFPRFPLPAAKQSKHAAPGKQPSAEALTQLVKQHTGLDIAIDEHLITIKHGVTRFRITLDCFTTHATANGTRAPKLGDESSSWVTVAELESLPLNVTARKIAKLLASSAPEQTSSAPARIRPVVNGSAPTARRPRLPCQR